MDRQHQQSLPDFSRDRIESLTTGLRRLARGLVRSEADADDLVQDVWVAALRNRPDDEGRLGGWFRRTLRNTASDRRRDEARRARREAVAAMPEAVSGDEHDQYETLRALLTEVEALEEPYRSAVRLRFLEGEPPRRIAKRLGVPVTTVHSRIQRGLARLRERLDARTGGDRKAWLAALAPWARPEGALLGAGALAGLVALMKTQVAVVVAVCVLGGGGAATWWLMGGDGVARVGLDAGPGPEGPDTRVVAMPGVEVGPLERESVSLQMARPDVAGADLARVRGRCVDDVTGAPLADVLAVFDGYPGTDDLSARHARLPPWTDPEPVRTDAQGCFEFVFTAHPAMQHGLDLSLDGYAPRTGRWREFAPGQLADLGEIRMLRGFLVEGLVLGEDDVPHPDIGIQIEHLPLPIRTGMGANDTRTGRVGPEGRFEFPVPLPRGTWPIAVSGGVRLSEPRSITVPLVEPLIVRVREPEPRKELSGRLVDQDGLPLDQISLHARSARGRSLSTFRTDADGRFTIRQREPDDDAPIEIVANDSRGDARIARARVAVSAQWGDRDVVLEVERTGQLELLVVDEVTGTPIEDYAVCLEAGKAGSRPVHGLRESGVHLHGRVRLQGLRRGDNAVTVYPRDPRWLPSTPRTIHFYGEPAVEPLVVRVQRAAEFHVWVVDAQGSPVGDARVELIDPGIGQEESFTVATPVHARSTWGPSGPLNQIWRLPGYFDVQQTDGDGRCRVFYDPEFESGFVLRASRSGYQSTMRMFRPEPGMEVEFRLLPPTVVTGRISADFSDYRQTTPEVWLLDPKSPDSSRMQWMPLDSDGSFEFSDVVPGRYELEVRLRRTFRWGSFGRSSCILPVRSLRRELDVARSRVTDLGDLRVDLQPAVLTGRILVGGEAPKSARLWFVAAADGPWKGTSCVYTVDDDGRFHAGDLPPGSWQPFVAVGCDDLRCASWTRATEVLEVRPGERAEVVLELPRRVVRARVVDAEGRPLAGVRVSVEFTEHVEGGQAIERQTDGAGEFALDPAPDVPFQFRVDGHPPFEPSHPAVVEPADGGESEPVEILLRVREG